MTQAGQQCRTSPPSPPDHYCDHEDKLERLIGLLEHWANEGVIGLTRREWGQIARIVLEEEPA